MTEAVLKRKLDDIVSLKDTEDRALSISSIDSDTLSDKLDIDNNEFKKRKRSELNLTEKNLVNDDEYDLEKFQTALVISSFTEPFQIEKKYPKPQELKDFEILIENKFIGLNPIDWKGKKYRFGVYSFPWIQGRESSGLIIKKGLKVENFDIGDEVFIASTSYRDLKTSTFQQYTVFDSRLVWKLPKNLSLKQSGSIGVGLVTAGSVIEELDLNFFNEKESEVKDKDNNSLLIWGGSSGVGAYIIQFAKLLKFKTIISVSSRTHEEYLKSIGVTHILDRFKPIEELNGELLEIVGEEGLQIGIDVVGKETSNHVINFLNLNNNEEKSKTFVGVVSKPSNVEEISKNIKIKEVLIKRFHENLEFGSNFVKKTHDLLLNGEIKPQKNLKIYKGFEGIDLGLKDLEKYGASNEKYIVEL